MAKLFRHEPDGPYWMSYQVDGKRVRESTGTKNKRLAEQCYQSRLGEVVQGKFKLADQRRSPTFQAFSIFYMEFAKANKRSWNRDEIMVANLIPFFGHLPLNRIEPFKVEQFKIERVGQVKPATVNRETALLKRILNLAVEWKKIETNPIAKVKKFKEPPPSEFFLNVEEAQRLVDVCREPFRWIVITALHTGMRRDEILYLKWQDVNLVRRTLRVVHSKNGESRSIPLDDTLFTLLNSIPKRREYVFAQENGKPYAWIGRAWRNALAKAGLKCRFHELRHTFASHLVMSGADLLTVQKLLGHKSLSMVQRYAHLSDEHQRNAVQTLDAALSRKSDTILSRSGNVVDFPKASNG